MSKRLVIGTFESERELLRATRHAREAAYRIQDVYTPYPVHELSKIMGLRPSLLTWVCFGCGLVGLALALWFQYWTSSTNWPVNVGGKPFDSLPAFIPIAFEITILFAGLGVVAALFIRCGLWPGARSRQPRPEVTDDKFVLVLQILGARNTVSEARGMLEQDGAVEVQDLVEEDGR